MWWTVKSLGSVASAIRAVVSGWDGGEGGGKCSLERDAPR